MDLFTLSATLGLNREAYTKGLKEAQGETESFVSKALSSFTNFAKLGAAKLADAATVGVKDLVAGSIETGRTFDAAISQVAATMGKTVEQMQNSTGTVQLAWGEFTGNLREYAQEMGEHTMFSATQAAEALNYMALAGYDTQESMSMLPNVLNLAAAGGMELARASDMITDSQSALGLSFDDTTKLVDQMAATASNTNTSVAQLGDAILAVGASARDVKGGITEINTVLGLLADTGTKGAEGGTRLRNILLSMGGRTDEQAKAWKNLGVEAYDASGNLRDLQEVFSDLRNKMSGMGTQQVDSLLRELGFNVTDLGDVKYLLRLDAERWEEVRHAINASDGAAQKMADTMTDNLEGSITKLNSALEALRIKISDRLSPTLKEFVDIATDEVSNITSAFQEGGISGAIDQVTKSAGAMYDAVVKKFKSSDSKGLQQVGNVLEKIRVVFTWITQSVSTITDTVRLISNAFDTQGLSGVLDTVVGKLEEFWKTTKRKFLSSDSAGLRAVGTAMEKLEAAAGKVKTAWSTVTSFFSGLWENLKTGVNNIIDWINEKFGLNIPHIEDIELPTMEQVVETVKGWWEGLKDKVTAVCTWVLGLFEHPAESLEQIKAKIAEWWTPLRGGVEKAIVWTLQLFGMPQEKAEEVKELLKMWWTAIKDIATQGVKWFLSLPDMPSPHHAGYALRAIIGQWWDLTKGIATELVTWIMSLMGMPDENAQATEIKGWWTDKVLPLLKGVLDFTLGLFGFPDASEIAEKIKSLFKESEGENGENKPIISVLFGDKSLPSLTTVTSAISTWWSDITKNIGNLFSDIFYFPPAQDLIDQAREGFNQFIGWINTTLGTDIRPIGAEYEGLNAVDEIKDTAQRAEEITKLMDDLVAKYGSNVVNQTAWWELLGNLHSLIPELDTDLANHANSIDGVTTNIRDQIKAWEEVTLAETLANTLQEKRNEVAESQKKLTTAQIEQAVSQQKLTEASEQYKTAIESIIGTIRKLNYGEDLGGFEDLINAFNDDDIKGMAAGLSEVQNSLIAIEGADSTNVQLLSSAISEQKEVMDNYNDAAKDNEHWLKEIDKAERDLMNKQASYESYEQAITYRMNEMNQSVRNSTSSLESLGATLNNLPTQKDIYVNVHTLGAGDVSADGSHAKGLNYVPYDNYVAELHRGETVLNADDARKWRNGNNSNIDLSVISETVGIAIREAMAGMTLEVDKQVLGRVATAPVSRGIAADLRARRYS